VQLGAGLRIHLMIAIFSVYFNFTVIVVVVGSGVVVVLVEVLLLEEVSVGAELAL
jgi:hypothetical protein